MFCLQRRTSNNTITSRKLFDPGYLGIENDFPDLKAVLPVKKKRNIELTKTEKKYTKRHIMGRESNSRTYYLQDTEIWNYGK